MIIPPITRGGSNRTFIQGAPVTANQTLDGSKTNYSTGVKGSDGYKQVLAASNHQFKDIDISWLPAAAETYEISGDINDYVISDVPAVTIDVPNRNTQAFPFEEISYFSGDQGKLVYQTFEGKPSCLDHDNNVAEDPNRAKGVIFSSSLQYVPEYDVYKIRLLQGWDRTKDSKLASDILTGKRKYYSMGALVSQFLCSVCGQNQQAFRKCSCPVAGSLKLGKLVYSLCLDCVFIENSSVSEPADFSAEGHPIE